MIKKLQEKKMFENKFHSTVCAETFDNNFFLLLFYFIVNQDLS